MTNLVQDSKSRRKAFEQIPPGWARVTIKEICDLNPGLPELPERDTDVSFVPMAAVSDESGTIRAAETRPFWQIAKGYSQFRNGDVLWAKITPCMENGKAAVAEDLLNGVGCGSTEFYVLRSTGAVIPEFLHRFLRQPSYRNAAAEVMTGAVGQARVPKEFLLETQILLPPLSEQQRILDGILAFSDRIGAVNRALETATEMLTEARRSLLESALRGDLTRVWRRNNAPLEDGSALLKQAREAHRKHWEKNERQSASKRQLLRSQEHRGSNYTPPEPAPSTGLFKVPSCWTWASGAELVQPGAEIVYGIVQPGPKLSKGIPYVRGMDIENGRILLDQLKKTSPQIANRYSRSALKGGDVLLGIIRATKVAVVPRQLEGGNITQGTARFRPSRSILTAFLAYALESPSIQFWLHRHYRGIDMPGLNLQDVRRVPIPLPSIREQREIVRRLRLTLARLDAASAACRTASTRLDLLNQSLLALAFSGKLVKQNPKDEPASLLLQRIRDTRQTTETPSSRRTKKSSLPLRNTKMQLRDFIEKTFDGREFTFEELRKAADKDYDELKTELFSLLKESARATRLLSVRFKDDEEMMVFALLPK